MRRAVLLLSVLALVLSACDGGTKATEHIPLPTPTVAGTIAFAKVDNGWGDIYVIRTDGTGLKRLAASEDSEEMPAWSPDGSKIAYSVGTPRSAAYTVRVMNADGSGQEALIPEATRGPLTPDATRGWFPAWSPDGMRIAFYRYAFGMLVVNADGSGLTQVSSGTDDRYTTWAPDGRIFFLGLEESDVYSMEPDGSGLAPVTRLGYVGGFSLSPDGRQLVIHDKAHDRLALVPASGKGTPVALVDEVSRYVPTPYVWPAWSPDGNAIAFASSDAENPDGSDLFIVNADGSGLSVVPGTGPVYDPVWQPT